MMAPIQRISVWLVLALVVYGSAQEQTTQEPSSGDKVNELAQAIRKFSQELYHEASKLELGNFVYSPYSLHMALSMLTLGAPKGSQTFKELSDVLWKRVTDGNALLKNYLQVIQRHEVLQKDEGTEIKLANKIFSANGFKIKEDFQNQLSEFYNTSIDTVDFGDSSKATDAINSFVNNKTEGFIPSLFESGSLDVDTQLALINAIYFKGLWDLPFNVSNTEPMEFNIDSDRRLNYSYGMNLVESFRTAEIGELNSNILEMKYKSSNLVMIIVLPKLGQTIDEIDKLMRRFDLNHIKKQLDTVNENGFGDLHVQIPRFEISFEWNGLVNVLERLGVKSLFDVDKANLTNISDDQLHASKIVHKAIIKVNEEGSEAAAATGISVVNRNSIPTPDFIVDRPFIFYIYDNQNDLPLFIGRVVDPSNQFRLKPTKKDTLTVSAADEEEGSGDPDRQKRIRYPNRGQDVIHIKENEDYNEKIEDERFNQTKN